MVCWHGTDLALFDICTSPKNALSFVRPIQWKASECKGHCSKVTRSKARGTILAITFLLDAIVHKAKLHCILFKENIVHKAKLHCIVHVEEIVHKAKLHCIVHVEKIVHNAKLHCIMHMENT